MNHFSAEDGAKLRKAGVPMLKKPNPVWLLQQSEAFSVKTTEGTLTGKPGDFVAYDPISGHVWPVAASYVAQHYEPVPGEEVAQGAV